MVSSISIEAIMYSNFIKYPKLAEMTQQEFAGSNACDLNVYIDVTMFTRLLYNDFFISDENCLASIVLNYCAHIKDFYKRLGVRVNIILVYSDETDAINKQFLPEYNYNYLNKRSVSGNVKIEMINIQILELLCRYLPGIYLKKGTVEPAVIISYLMRNDFNNGFPNIVFSTSPFSYQLPCYNPCVLFRKKKFKQDDISFSVNSSNALVVYAQEVSNAQIRDVFNNLLISTAFCLSGLSKRDVKKKMSISKTLHIITNMNPNTYGDIESMYDQICTFATSKDILGFTMFEWNNRFKALDLNYQIKLYETLPESRDTTYIVDLNDPDKVKYINNNYFINNPIDLQRL